MDIVANLLRGVLDEVSPATPLALVGFSLGAIIAANYTCKYVCGQDTTHASVRTCISSKPAMPALPRSASPLCHFAALRPCLRVGESSPVACAVALSGSFDTRTNIQFHRSRRLWQPFLTRELKQNFVSPNVRKLRKRGLTLAQVEGASDVVDYDMRMVAPYHRYKTLDGTVFAFASAARFLFGTCISPPSRLLALNAPALPSVSPPDRLLLPRRLLSGYVCRLP